MTCPFDACIGDATAQPTRPILRGSVDKAASIGVSSLGFFHVSAMELFSWRPVSAAKARFIAIAAVSRGLFMSLGAILVIILILVLLGVIPSWGYSNAWGYGPSGIVGTILIIVLILLVLGRI
jgi:hypothetical protein